MFETMIRGMYESGIRPKPYRTNGKLDSINGKLDALIEGQKGIVPVLNEGFKEKTAVVGAKDRTTNKISAQQIPETTKARLEHFVESHVHKGAKKYTDEDPSYSGLTNQESVKHSVGEYVRGMAHTNGMESFWAMVRRGYDGTFHHISKVHLHRYVNEFAGRHNIRTMDTIEMMGTVAENMAGSRPTYESLIGHTMRR